MASRGLLYTSLPPCDKDTPLSPFVTYKPRHRGSVGGIPALYGQRRRLLAGIPAGEPITPMGRIAARAAEEF